MDNANIQNILYSKIIEHSSIGIIVINDSYEVVLWNASMESFSGLKSGETIGQNFFSIFPTIKDNRLSSALRRSFLSGLPYIFSNSLNQFLLPLYGRFSKIPKNKIEHSISIVPITIEKSKKFSLIQVTNVTSHKLKENQLLKQTFELKRIQDELLNINNELRIKEELANQASKAKSYFLSNMSHELRTPIHGILGLLQFMEEELKKGELEKAKDKIELINNLGNHLLSLVNDVLTINKIESGKLELNVTHFELIPQIENIINTSKTKILQKNIEFILDIDPSLPKYFCGDEVKIRQIIFNLISNSMKHTEKGYIKIKISFYPNEFENIIAQVIDTGSGIPIEHQNRIFGMFEQVQDEYNRKFEGAGIGLFITKKIIHLMGGQISFTSVPNVETTFTFSIHLEICKNQLVSTHDICTIQNNNLKEQITIPDRILANHILIVDDNPINLMILERHLKNLGFQSIETAVDGDSAIELYKAKDFDLIFLDIQLPDKDGFEVTTSIFAISKDFEKKIPIIIAFTANAIDDSIIKYKQAGMTDCLIKPYTVESLKGILITHLNKR